MEAADVQDPPPDSAAVPTENAPDTRPAKRRAGASSRLLLESALIVLSVLLGFALSEWRENQIERERADLALESFRREIQANFATLKRVHPKHVQLAERLGAVARADTVSGGTAFDVLVALLPEGGLDTPPLREAAWEAAVSTGALRLLNYETAALLSETYQIQRFTIVPTVQRLSERVMDLPNFDPRTRNMALRVHHMVLLELTGQEAYLMEAYQRTLAQLPRTNR